MGGGRGGRFGVRQWEAAGVGGAAAAVASFIGVAASIPHGGSNLPPWPKAGAALTVVAHGVRLPRAPFPAAHRWQPLAAVSHGRCVANCRSARRQPKFCKMVKKYLKIDN
jgi:hypothetical protein